MEENNKNATDTPEMELTEDTLKSVSGGMGGYFCNCSECGELFMTMSPTQKLCMSCQLKALQGVTLGANKK